MATLKIDPSQKALLMNHPIHYQLAIRFLDKETMFEVECEYGQVQEIKKIIEGPK